MEAAQNPLDKPLEEAVADQIASNPVDGNVHVLGRRGLARPAALEGFREGIALAERIIGEMADDYGSIGEEKKAEALRDAAEQISTLPGDLP